MGKKTKVVIDNNVLVSAFGWYGKPEEVVRLVIAGNMANFTSMEMLSELVWCRRSSLHKSFVIHASKARRESFLENDSGQAGMTRLIKFISGTPH